MISRVCYRVFRVISPAVIAAAWGAGCASNEEAKPAIAAAPTQADRLARFYPELRAGRFAVIADFEDSAHAELVSVDNASAFARAAVDARAGRTETGANGLSFTTASPADAVVFSGKAGGRGYLTRNWRAFDVLLTSVYVPPRKRGAPQNDLVADLSITAAQSNSVHSLQHLKEGWQTLEWDVGELADQMPLDDVRELRISISGSPAPLDVRLDDIILTTDRENLLGDPKNTTGALFVQRVGRRWNIGAGSRFELTFANGQIAGFYDLASDPLKTSNLVRGTVLGPHLMYLASRSPVADESTSPASTVVEPPARVRVDLVEMNSSRVVLETQWLGAPDSSSTSKNGSDTTWRWTVYPTGQIYYELSLSDVPHNEPAPLNLVMTVSSEEDDEAWTLTAAPPVAQGSSTAAPFAILRKARSETALLWAPSVAALSGHNASAATNDARARSADMASGELPAIRVIPFPEQRRLWFVAMPQPQGEDRRIYSGHLYIACGETLSDDDAAARARAYNFAPLLTAQGDTILASAALPRDAVFDASGGAFEIIANPAGAKLVLNARHCPIFSPVFLVRGLTSSQNWVYIDDRLISATNRSPGGELLFQLPGRIDRSIRIDVLVR